MVGSTVGVDSRLDTGRTVGLEFVERGYGWESGDVVGAGYHGCGELDLAGVYRHFAQP